MIPKIIHYCWFGGKKMPKLAKKCLKSWEKYCPDYKIICWNEENFDISQTPLYVRQAYERKKWAFVTDYVRLKIVYENGGIYLDTDVEVLKNLDKFLIYEAFFGFENSQYVATGLGFGATQKNEIIHQMLEVYKNIPFIKEDNSIDITPCPVRNTEVLVKNGLVLNNSFQILKDKIAIFPKDYFCPIAYESKEKNFTNNTYTIHWFNGSWIPLNTKLKIKFYDIVKNILGEKIFNKLKRLLKSDVKNRSERIK